MSKFPLINPGWRGLDTPPGRMGAVILALVFALTAGSAGFAETHLVDSIAALQSQINQAMPGDRITLKDGIYTTSAAISVRCRGAADTPVIIAAESVGGVEITGTNGFNVTASAAFVVVSGFTFTHASGKNVIGAGTSHVRFTRNLFRCVGDGPYLSIAGDDAQADDNEFADKKTAGSMLAVGGTGGQVARRIWIHHNYFHDFTNAGASGAEMIRLGLSALSLSTGAAVVEHNLLVRCRGENDLISNRSSGNTYRYNTLLDSPTSHLSLRHGNDCLVYGNIFRNTEGVRIFGDRHQVFSNYLEKNYIGVTLGNGNTEVAEGGALTGHDRPDNCVIAFNTFVDNRTHYQMSRRTPDALGATNTTFANNLLVGGDVAAKIEGANAGATWTGNLLWNTVSAGDLPAAGYTMVDPLLVADASGVKRPQPGSPAIASADGHFFAVTVDFDGQPRPQKKTRGADEPSSDPAIAELLSVDDVGPRAKERNTPPPPPPVTIAPPVPPAPPPGNPPTLRPPDPSPAAPAHEAAEKPEPVLAPEPASSTL